MAKDSIGKRIEEKRRSKNWNISDLASYLGVPYNTVLEWETDTSLPDDGILPALASALDTNVDYILTGAEDDSDNQNVKTVNAEPKKSGFLTVLKAIGMGFLFVLSCIGTLIASIFEIKIIGDVYSSLHDHSKK